jgi:hypothetical protein
MKKDLLKDSITPAEGEQSVRSYFCTYYRSRFIGLKSDGYLEITNKRVIFQALGSSRAGNSSIQSEVPIADVSGISSYTGASFSFGSFLGNLALAVIFGVILVAILAAIGAASAVSTYPSYGDSTKPASVSADQVLGWIIAIGTLIGVFAINKKSIWCAVIAASSAASFGYLGGRSLLTGMFSMFTGISSSSSISAVLFVPAVILGIYAFVRALMFGWKPTFSLAIGSKGGANTPISISGGSGILNISAARALTARPADDADVMLKELGAVIIDIQTLGDLGIAKWKMN